MSRLFGWDLPPGVSLSDPGGPNDPVRLEWEAAMERLGEALYAAEKLGAERRQIEEEWAAAAEQAFLDEQEEQAAEEEFYRQQDEAYRRTHNA
jgi:hypothetical protein